MIITQNRLNSGVSEFISTTNWLDPKDRSDNFYSEALLPHVHRLRQSQPLAERA